MKAFVLMVTILAPLAAGAQQTPANKVIMDKLSHLREVPDAERGRATQNIAFQIRRLPPGKLKGILANGLANLSTEGDFGHETLQIVADTLAGALRETPEPDENALPAMAYLELAELAAYEHVHVTLDAPAYLAARAQVAAIDKVRERADFTLVDLDGKAWTLSDLKGKFVLVNFWATWCPPCRKEMPDLEALYQQFKTKGFVVLGISDEVSTTVQPFVTQHRYTYPSLLDPGRRVNGLFHVDGIPKTFLYNREGHLVAQAMDMRTKGQLLEMLSNAGLR